jgi:hypothetical protein
LLRPVKTLSKLPKEPDKASADFSDREFPSMKTTVTGFLSDQSGAADFNDGLTAFCLVVVFPITLYFMYSTFGGVFEAVFGLAASAVYR